MPLFDFLGSGYIAYEVSEGGETYHLLQENSDDILLETGDFLLLESAP